MSGIKNIDKAQMLTLKEMVAYQEGQVVSRTLAQNDAVSVTLFSFDRGEEISTHESGGDAFVTCLAGLHFRWSPVFCIQKQYSPRRQKCNNQT